VIRVLLAQDQAVVRRARNHLSAAMRKLDARSRVEAARVAEERGWL
jgi:DNA-binding CsgD family transcriptional regulator